MSEQETNHEQQRQRPEGGGEGGFTPFPEQNAAGVDLTLIRAMLELTPAERLARSDQATAETLRLMEYGRRHRERQRSKPNGTDSEAGRTP